MSAPLATRQDDPNALGYHRPPSPSVSEPPTFKLKAADDDGDGPFDRHRKSSYSGHSTFPAFGSREGSTSNLSSVLESDDSNPEEGDNVNVVIRVRPLNNKELQEGESDVIHFPGEGQIVIDKVEKANGNKPKNFTFNVVFEPDATQQDVFEHSGVKQIVDMALDGFSCTIFAYGQTGSGKTYTLAGSNLPISKLSTKSKSPGLMQCCFHYLFQQLAGRQNNKNNNFTLQASCLEIYNEQVVDLLNPEQKKYLTVRWAKDKGFYVENLFVVPCFEEDDIMAVMEEGLHNRQVASNNVNEASSRSHCILTLNITNEVRDPEDENTFLNKHGKIIFVDLAGSEKVTEKSTSSGSLNETNKINRSLLTLGKCISALGDSKKKTGHIPYRDSKLTKLLKHSLGGNGVTLMIACISPSKWNLSETLNTLYYAARTKKIKNRPQIMLDPREQQILSLKREVKTLKAENQYLREQLHYPKTTRNPSASQPAKNMVILDKLKAGLNTGKFPPNVDVREVHSLVNDYAAENETLREENADLLRNKQFLIRDHELVVKENERLTKKLEGSGRSGKSSLSSGSLSGLSDLDRSNARGSPQIGRPPGNLSYPARPPHHLPKSISKEMQIRRIGENVNGVSNSIGPSSKQKPRRNSWDNGSPARRSSPSGSNRHHNDKPKKQAAPTGNGMQPVRRAESDQHLRQSVQNQQKQSPKNNVNNHNVSNGTGNNHKTEHGPKPLSYESPMKKAQPPSPHKEHLLKQGDSREPMNAGGRSK